MESLNNQLNDRSVTLIVAHSDDECLGALHLFEKGKIKKIIVITDSSKQLVPPFIETGKYIEQRRSETKAFCESYDIRDISFLNYPDGELANLGDRSISALYDYIETVIRMSSTVVYHSYKDLHPDHKIIAGLCNRALNCRKHLKLRGKFLCDQAREIHILSKPDINPKYLSKTAHENNLITFRKFYRNQYELLKKNDFPFEQVLHNWETIIEL